MDLLSIIVWVIHKEILRRLHCRIWDYRWLIRIQSHQLKEMKSMNYKWRLIPVEVWVWWVIQWRYQYHHVSFACFYRLDQSMVYFSFNATSFEWQCEEFRWNSCEYYQDPESYTYSTRSCRSRTAGRTRTQKFRYTLLNHRHYLGNSINSHHHSHCNVCPTHLTTQEIHR